MADETDPIACLEQLRTARQAYDEAYHRNQETERILTSRLNDLNAAQKAFDEAVAELKKDAPWKTDWHAERKLKVEAFSVRSVNASR